MSLRKRKFVRDDDDEDYEQEEEESSSSSSDFMCSSEEVPNHPRWIGTWSERNGYVQTQLDMIKSLGAIAALSQDPTFRLHLEVKMQNMYRQVEPLLECENPDNLVVKHLIEERGDEPITITRRIKQRGEYPEDYNLRTVGQAASTIYQRKYNRKPRKTIRYIADQPTIVNEYTDFTVIDEALDEQ